MPKLPKHLIAEMEKAGTLPKGTSRSVGRNKYGVAPVAERTHDGIVYASKAEMMAFRMFVGNPDVVWVARQPQFPLAGGVSLRVDFLVCTNPDPNCKWMTHVEAVEIKGKETADWKIKKRLWQNTPGLPPMRVIQNGKTLETITPLPKGR